MNVGAIGGYNPTTYISPYANGGVMPTVGRFNPATTTQGVDTGTSVDSKKVAKTDPSYQCQTCANRKYQDGSDENVSFKSATNIAPESAATAVRSHEQEHVANAYDKAKQDNGKVVSATVQIHTAICPECGRTYVSGGTTRTQIKYTNEDNPYQKNLKNMQAGLLRGANLDITI